MVNEATLAKVVVSMSIKAACTIGGLGNAAPCARAAFDTPSPDGKMAREESALIGAFDAGRCLQAAANGGC